MSLNTQGINRRSFLKASATGAAGLLIGFYFRNDAESLVTATEVHADAPIVFNAWIHVGTDDYVTILIDKSEMGQSILTGLAMIAADGHSVKLACRVLEVTRAGYYGSVTRSPSARAIRHAWLTDLITQIHAASRGTYGAPRVHAEFLSVQPRQNDSWLLRFLRRHFFDLFGRR